MVHCSFYRFGFLQYEQLGRRLARPRSGSRWERCRRVAASNISFLSSAINVWVWPCKTATNLCFCANLGIACCNVNNLYDKEPSMSSHEICFKLTAPAAVIECRRRGVARCCRS